MQADYLHPKSLQHASEIQRELAAKVITIDQFAHIVETAHVSQPQNFPYITGFLSFREAPALIAAWQKIKIKPPVIMRDFTMTETP